MLISIILIILPGSRRPRKKLLTNAESYITRHIKPVSTFNERIREMTIRLQLLFIYGVPSRLQFILCFDHESECFFAEQTISCNSSPKKLQGIFLLPHLEWNIFFTAFFGRFFSRRTSATYHSGQIFLNIEVIIDSVRPCVVKIRISRTMVKTFFIWVQLCGVIHFTGPRPLSESWI